MLTSRLEKPGMVKRQVEIQEQMKIHAPSCAWFQKAVGVFQLLFQPWQMDIFFKISINSLLVDGNFVWFISGSRLWYFQGGMNK